jgi:hypothetical protein
VKEIRIMNRHSSGAIVVTCLLVLGLSAGMASPAAAQTGEVRAELTLDGDVPGGEIHQLYFNTGNAGQTLFGICGQMLEPCRAKTYEIRLAGLDAHASFTYRFERVTPAGVVTSYFEGKGVVGEVAQIMAVFRYGAVPDTATSPAATPRVPWLLVVGLTATVPLFLALRRRRLVR